MTTKNLEFGVWVQCNPEPGGEQYYLQPVGGSTIFNLWGAGGAVPSLACGGSTTFNLVVQYHLQPVGGSTTFNLLGAVPSSACGGEYPLQPAEGTTPS